jgi:Ca2+-binding RTX toxin-like protein
MGFSKYVTLVALLVVAAFATAQAVGATTHAKRIVATNGDDVVKGTSGADTLHLLNGDDKGYGRGGNDIILGDETGPGGNDFISGGAGNDRVFGMAGNDTVNGDSGNDVVHGGDGVDVMNGGAGNDTLDDAPRGGATAGDHLNGGAGNDDIYSRDGKRDYVDCGSGNDIAKADHKDKVAANCEKIVKIG